MYAIVWGEVNLPGKVCLRGFCTDGRKEACHDSLDSRTRVPVLFIATKPGEELQTGVTEPAEYLATYAIMSYRRDNTLLKHSAHSLV